MKNKGELLADILNDYGSCYCFLHNTKEKSIAEKIMNEGFVFENQLSHSTDRVNPYEPIEITYFLFQRKDYGPYTLIIAIPRTVYEHYTEISNKYNLSIEDILTTTKPIYGDNDELIYTISPQHVLGYFYTKTGEFIKNKLWDPKYDLSDFKSFRRKNSDETGSAEI
jgi:hypothetical protein